MRTWQLVLAGIAVLVGTPIACSLVNTTAAVTTAPGRVVQKTLQTDNIIGNYEAFFDRKASYDARLSQVRTHKQLLADATDPAEKSRLSIELAAMKQSCRELATRYNADAQKMNRALFRDNDLPTTLSETDCDAA